MLTNQEKEKIRLEEAYRNVVRYLYKPGRKLHYSFIVNF
jgi:hypothetical protein